MNRNYIFSDASEALPTLLEDLLELGDEVSSRAGRTKELTHVGITLWHPWRREILLDHRRPSIAAQIAETAWVISGRDDIEWLGHYLPRAKDFSDDGKTWRAGYGKRLRAWPRRQGDYSDPIDQLRYVVNTLKESPLSRQAVMTLWDPQIDTDPGKDIPCNDWITFSNRLGKLDMHVALRSNDAIWGWSGINAFEWSSLQEIVAGLLNVGVGKLHFSTTSFHLYEHHWDRARKIAPSGPMNALSDDSPRFAPAFRDLEYVDGLFRMFFGLEEKIRNGVYVSNQVDYFPEPMLQSWLRVLQWWWTGQRGWLVPLSGTRLEAATVLSVQPDRTAKQGLAHPGPLSEAREELGAEYRASQSAFIKTACELHNEKHAAYGDSWKRRGEMLGIMANIARKIDRLGKSQTADETSADTAMDLMIYLAKYRTWLTDTGWGSDSPTPVVRSDDPKWANEILGDLDVTVWDKALSDQQAAEEHLRLHFDQLEKLVMSEDRERYVLVDAMLEEAYRLARYLWEKDHPVMTDAASVGGGIPGSWTDEYQGADHE